MRVVGLWMVAVVMAGAQTAVPAELKAGREAIAAKEFAKAKAVFVGYAAGHPNDAQGFLGEGEADIGLHRYETAEMEDRKAVALEPELWIAHKDLVLIEAKLGRWEEFDRERAVLRAARERGAPNITARESDVIDSFSVGGEEWIVREYFEPVGRSQARYNFERFVAGKAAEYVSLEPANAAQNALKRDEQVQIGADSAAVDAKRWALNWYTGSGHGTVKMYAEGEPKYEQVRADAMRWLRASVAKP
jgi:tetratricopeptide (TPR) repeat protein